jgi:hypothetical protein
LQFLFHRSSNFQPDRHRDALDRLSLASVRLIDGFLFVGMPNGSYRFYNLFGQERAKPIKPGFQAKRLRAQGYPEIPSRF